MNQLTEFPVGLTSLTRLDRLEIFMNNIPFIPNLSSMKSLRKLTVSYNPLTEIPQLPAYVAEFHMSGTNIAEILSGQSRRLDSVRTISFGKFFFFSITFKIRFY